MSSVQRSVLLCVIAVAVARLSSVEAHAQAWQPPAAAARCPSKWGANDTPDLMAALEESLAKMKGERLEDLPKKELLEKAADKGIEGRSKMSKEELVEALET